MLPEDGELETEIRAPDFGPFGEPLESGAPPPMTPAAAPESRDLLVVGAGYVFAGRYRIRKKLARGGMSTIWEAIDERIDRPVALKLMSPHLADEPDYCARFEQEAKAAARLASPNVVALHDYGIHEGLPFMVLELLAGEDLFRRTRRVGAIGLEATVPIIEQAASALHAAHRAGIVHRDVKPHNLFLAKVDDNEVVKLLDFGVAKHAGTVALRTRTGLMVGSPYFMSPEQVQGARDIDLRSDLFSLAACAYLCLTGRTPFVGAMPAVFLAILDGRPTPPSELRPELPPAVDRFFARALALDPADRFETAIELAQALRGASGGVAPAAAVKAPAAEAAARARPPARREPSPVRARIVVEDDEPPRPSEYPTAIAEVPDEALRRGWALTLPPPARLHAALFPEADDPRPGSSARKSERMEAASALAPSGAMPVPALEQTVILDEAAVAPRLPDARPAIAVAPVPAVDAPNFSIARSYQRSIWASPVRERAPRRSRNRLAVSLILASMVGFVFAVAVLITVWAILG